MAYQIQVKNSVWKLLLKDGAQIESFDQQAFDKFEEQFSFDAVELRSCPYDTPRHFEPVTQQGDAVGGAAVLIRAQVLEAVGGLDALLPDDACMQDLSARLRAGGYTMGYYPFAAVCTAEKPALQNYLDQVAGSYLLACKYGTAQEKQAARTALMQTVKSPQHFDGVRKALVKALPQLLAAGLRIRPQGGIALSDVAQNRELRGVCKLTPFAAQPLVSVVIRTHKRKEVLRRTLQCLYWQTYKNFEVVIIEDGEDTAGDMVKTDFPGLNIRYFATGTPVGRGRAGNIGIEKSLGDYVCFLDDDDYYYPDYIELHLARFMESDADLIISSIMAFEIDVESRDPFLFQVHKIYPVIFDHLNLLDMCVKCRVPMTGAMFRREMYDQVGGMREDIDADEDWAMWLRYWKIARRIDDTKPDIPRAVSMFGYPADPVVAQRRLDAYEIYDKIMLADPDLRFALTAEKLQALIRQQKLDVGHLYRIGALEETLQKRSEENIWRPLQQQEQCVTAQQLNGLYHAVLCEAAKQLETGSLPQWLEQEGL